MRKGMSGVSFNFIPCAELEIPNGMYTPRSQAAPGMMRTKLVWSWRYNRGRIPPQCAPAKVRGRVGILGFLGKSKYSWFQGGCPMREGGVFLWGRSVHSTSIFPFWNARIQKLKNSIFTFSDLRYMQGFK